ncbi:MAG: hypothetical protein A2847_01455 [Candidatus Sungbacteria bacterium RIFCSPHIGHO2_01_FULL_50_25]|uniref:Uncharacterized protein n=1 Tax=Candidatus Sungbacteria bacterium RIFCSPHIGHO2_01_FULL_50_25 TaxID=1802265 RepID=A0A1G2K7L1_9BACT|nr:MAG: hypothetical protein A2847_01455 [Candidatus Sungbacteria bacterium RIFCSPHIGHO2_01_FULL_50_25]
MNWLKENWFKIIVAFALIVVSGSLFYYYVYFLPRQNINSQQDIKAIRNVIAPTQEQLQAQREVSKQASDSFDKAMEQYSQCQTEMLNKQNKYIEEQCAAYNDIFKFEEYRDCVSKVMDSAGYKQFSCQRPF